MTISSVSQSNPFKHMLLWAGFEKVQIRLEYILPSVDFLAILLTQGPTNKQRARNALGLAIHAILGV